MELFDTDWLTPENGVVPFLCLFTKRINFIFTGLLRHTISSRERPETQVTVFLSSKFTQVVLCCAGALNSEVKHSELLSSVRQKKTKSKRTRG